MNEFEQIANREIPGLKIEVEYYRHRQTGTRHYHLASDDANNAFMVAFPTLPSDSTGVAHILEHTTLCGSEKYPVRDPFFMMLRRSLNTFMNAFTSGDTTAYPFATQNEKDFRNLLSVYLDAVFFPNLDPLDFAQEGWRVEFDPEADDERLIYKGVVYNEMKGAMSAPSTQLWQHLYASIFPGSTYHFNSGGDPADIPDLTYDQLREFHARHYHPSHAVFMTYGNFCVHSHQRQFQSDVLEKFDRDDSVIVAPLQSRFVAPQSAAYSYAVGDESELTNGTHIVWGWLLGSTADPAAALEANFLAGMLLDHAASPLRQFLETTELADAPSELCGLDDSSREMVLCCGVEGTEIGHADHLTNAINDILGRIADGDFVHDEMENVVDRLEMAQRDVSGGSYPYGLQLISRALPGAMYEGDPFDLLDIDHAIENLRRAIRDPGYFSGLVSDRLLNNPHRVRVVMNPDVRKAESDQANERRRLDERLKGMDDAAKSAVITATEALKSRQDAPERAELLPSVTLADVPSTPVTPSGKIQRANGHQVTTYGVAANGILQAHWVCELPAFDAAEVEALPLFCEFVTELGEQGENYLETQMRRSKAGSIDAYASARAALDIEAPMSSRFVVRAKGLDRKMADLLDYSDRLLPHVNFDDTARMLDLLAQSRVDAEASITDRGHALAMSAAASTLSDGAYLDDIWEGPSSIAAVQTLDRECHDNPQFLATLLSTFESIREKLSSSRRELMVVADEAMLSSALDVVPRPRDSRPPVGNHDKFSVQAVEARTNVAFITNTQINFCAKAFRAVAEGHEDAPTLAVLSKYLVDGFLHSAIREKGGAYGAGAQFDVDSATFRFFSYRDPRLTETLDDFDRSINWVLSDKDERRLEESILGVIRQLDNPKPPAGTAISAYYDGRESRSDEFKSRFRGAVLDTSLADLKRVADRYLSGNDSSVAVITHRGFESEIDALKLSQVTL